MPACRPPSPVNAPGYATQFEPGPDDEVLWDVIEILKEHKGKYQVKWGGINPSTNLPWPNSWVPKHDCTDDLIRDWKIKKAEMRKKRIRKDEIDHGSNTSSSAKRGLKPKYRSNTTSIRKSGSSNRPRRPVPVVEIRSPKKRKLSYRTSGSTEAEASDNDTRASKKRKLTSNEPIESNASAFKEHQDVPEQNEPRHVKDASSHVASSHSALSASTSRSSQGRQSIAIDDPFINADTDYKDHHPSKPGDLASNASSRLPSPAALLEDSNTTIIPETQPSSPSVSNAGFRLPTPDSKANVPVIDINGIPESKHVVYESKNNLTSKGFRPVPAISPSVFRQRSSNSCIVHGTQTSAIEEFLPHASLEKPKRDKGKGKMSDLSKEKTLLYLQRQEEEEESASDEPDHPAPQHGGSQAIVIDDIEDYGDIDYDITLQQRREQLAQEAPQTHKLLRKPLEDIQTCPLESQEAESWGRQASQIRSPTLNSLSTGALGPEDAPDASPIIAFAPGPNSSTEVHPSWTQQRLAYNAIASPVRQLDCALGLLHRKSAEIATLQDELETRAAEVAQLKKQTDSLQEELEERRRQIEALEVEVIKRTASEIAEPESQRQESVQASLSEMQQTQIIGLTAEVAELKSTITQLESDKELFRQIYGQASDACLEKEGEVRELRRSNESLQQQATTGVKQANLFWQSRMNTLEKELNQTRGIIEVFTEQLRRTEGIRHKAALLPMVQEAVHNAEEDAEQWRGRFMDMGKENTRLRLELKKWEDEDLARRNDARKLEEQRQKLVDDEAGAMEELVFLCPWRDINDQTRCGELVTSREKLREHFFEAGHL